MLVAVPPAAWHEVQLPVIAPWSNFDGTHATEPWQALQSMLVTMCPAGLPGACELSWQLAQPPMVSSWSKVVAGDQADVVWQAMHFSLVRT